mgnify:CR=1 FL=1
MTEAPVYSSETEQGAAVVTDEGDAFKGFVQGSDGKGGEALDGDNRPVVNPFTDNGKQSALGGYVPWTVLLYTSLR